MFAVIYRGYVLPGCEADYQTHWHTIANYFIKNCGALGSCLHQAEDGMWLAYSRWPDKATRDAAWPGDEAPTNIHPLKIQQAIVALKECKDTTRKLPDICLNVVDDLLVHAQ